MSFEKLNVLGQTLYKRDMSGLKVYFKEMNNMERIFNELTGAIRNGYTVAILTATIIISISLLVKESLYLLLETFVPYPEVPNIF